MKRKETTQQLTFRQMNVLTLVFGRINFKPILLATMLCLLGSVPALGQGWSLYGDSISLPTYHAFEFEQDSQGTLYIKYDSIISSLVGYTYIKKSSPNGWINACQPFANGYGSSGTGTFSLGKTTNNLYHFTWQGYTNKCERYDGNNWVQMGTVSDTLNWGWIPSYYIFEKENMHKIYEDASGVPFMCYGKRMAINGFLRQAKVIKFDGVDWQPVGQASLDDSVYNLTMDIAANTPYVSYIMVSNGDTSIVVKQFDGNTWNSVGTLPVTTIVVNGCRSRLTLDPNGVPYIAVAYYDGTIKRLAVLKYDGQNWVYVGSPLGEPILSNEVSTQIVFDTNATPYIAVDEIKVLKFDGANWIDVALPLQLDPMGRDTTPIRLQITPDNTLYAAVELGTYFDYWLKVMRLGAPSVSITTTADTVCPGEPFTLTANAVGFSGPVTYTWARNYNGSYNTIPLQTASISGYGYNLLGMEYRVIVSDGIVTDTAYKYITYYFSTVDMVQTPSSLCGASSVTYTVSQVSGIIAPQPVYTWYKNRFPVGTGTSYTDTNIVDGDIITVRMDNGCPSIISEDSIIVDLGSVRDTIYQTINPGQSYQGYTSTGIYMDTFALGNGCDSIRILHLTVNPVNGLVWPGDANSDGTANMNDALFIGLGYNVVGPVRPNASNNWVGQPCPNWITTFGTGTNHHHGDCNGSGQIDANDTVPILQNYGFTHLKSDTRQAGSPVVYLDPVVRIVPTGTRVHIPVKLGLAPDSATNVMGIAFSLNYNEALVVPGSAYFQAVNSWLGNVNSDVIYLQKPLQGGVIDAAVTRIDHTNRSGLGTIGMLSFITIDNISGKDLVEAVLNLGISNVTLMSNDGTILPVDFASDSIVVSQEVGIGLLGNPTLQVLLYPNPAKGSIGYSIEGIVGPAQYRFTDVAGKEVLAGTLQPLGNQAQGMLDVSFLARGVYFFRIINAQGQTIKKLVLE